MNHRLIFLVSLLALVTYFSTLKIIPVKTVTVPSGGVLTLGEGYGILSNVKGDCTFVINKNAWGKIGMQVSCVTQEQIDDTGNLFEAVTFVAK